MNRTDDINPFAAVLASQFDVQLEPEIERRERGEAPISDMDDLASAVLAGIGLAGPEAREGIEEVVRDGARHVGLELGSVSLRYQVLTVTAEPTVCALLRLQVGQLQSALDERFPGQVTGIRLKVGTVRGTTQSRSGGPKYRREGCD